MSIIKSIALPFNSDLNKLLRIPTRKSQKRNTFTVFIGENGTRKSLLLRQVLDQSLEAITKKEPISLGILKGTGTVIFAKIPKKVIAVSSASTDRFPSKPSTADRIRSTRYDVENYSYIGPRTAGNILSRNQSVDELVTAILSNPQAIGSRHKFLSEVLQQLELQRNFQIGFDFSTPFRSEKVKAFLERRHEEATGKKSQRSIAATSSALKFSTTASGKKFSKEIENQMTKYRRPPSLRNMKANEFPFVVYIDTEFGGIDTNGISMEALEWAKKIGILRPGRFTFKNLQDISLNQDDLSAGQWNLFSTMMSLALAVIDDSLILIDEPETGLHPAWQQNFLDSIYRAISHATGCHTLLATHSPLLLSSLDPASSHLVTLARLPNQTEISAKIEKLPFGWDASLILQETFQLEETRAPHLTELVDQALTLLAAGKKDNLAQLKTLVKKMKPYYDSLSDEDVGKGVIQSIINVVG